MDLTIGPNAFFWTAEAVRAFYRAVAASPGALKAGIQAGKIETLW